MEMRSILKLRITYLNLTTIVMGVKFVLTDNNLIIWLRQMTVTAAYRVLFRLPEVMQTNLYETVTEMNLQVYQMESLKHLCIRVSRAHGHSHLLVEVLQTLLKIWSAFFQPGRVIVVATQTVFILLLMVLIQVLQFLSSIVDYQLNTR